MERTVLAVTVLASLFGRGVYSFSGGAPVDACGTLSPNPVRHGADAQSSAVPYAIDLSPFDNDGTLQYTPGETYTLSLSGNNQQTFRGFFVQARLLADDNTRTGVFSVVSDMDSRLSSCSPANAGITHNNGNDKSSVNFNWTAPAAGTGAIRFGFAVVQVRATYWANQRTGMVADGSSGAVKLASTGLLTILVIALGLVLKEAF